MKKFLSTDYSETSFNVALLLLRLAFGLLICLNHGFEKLMHFGTLQYSFPDPLHIGHRWSLVLALFAEVFCALLVVLGLFTRVGALILFINMSVALWVIHRGAPLPRMESVLVYLVPFFSIMLVGPGKISVDGMMGR